MDWRLLLPERDSSQPIGQCGKSRRGKFYGDSIAGRGPKSPAGRGAVLQQAELQLLG
jgi:hypothetical protein